MTDATADFFERLGRHGHEPLLEKTSGTLRIDLESRKETERWLVSVDRGDLAVSHKTGNPDCTVRASKEVFDSVARGELNAMAAVLRGAFAVEGDPRILVRFQRLFPGPPAEASVPTGSGAVKR
jgi:putative sterol carrier protein